MYVLSAHPKTRVFKRHQACYLRKNIATLQVSWYVRAFLLQGNYTDPKTRLRYHSVEVYDIIKGFVRAPYSHRRCPGSTIPIWRSAEMPHSSSRLYQLD